MLFVDRYNDNARTVEVRLVNWQYRCTCVMFKLDRNCKHVQHVIDNELFIENVNIELPNWEKVRAEAQEGMKILERERLQFEEFQRQQYLSGWSDPFRDPATCKSSVGNAGQAAASGKEPRTSASNADQMISQSKIA
jgi:hypothetical protein